MSSRDVNPYQSPETNNRVVSYCPELRIVVERVSTGWLYRRFHVSGAFSCDIEYNGWGLGYETVLVNRLVIARAFHFWSAFAPRIDFAIATASGPLAARFEVAPGAFSFGGIQLYLGDHLVYAETSG